MAVADKALIQFGKSIKEFRIMQNMTQEDLALKAEIERSYMGKIERGEGNPSLRKIVRISKALKVPLNKIFQSFK